MTINAAEFSIDSLGNIRSISGTAVYSVLDLHTWLQDLADNTATSGDDNVSILSANPSKLAGPRATNKPMSLTLLNGFNIDDATAQRFNFGSIEQAGGNTLYTGVKSIGSPLVAASPIYIQQNGARITSYWGTPGHIQVLVKAKNAGALISNGDIRAFSRKFGQTYSDFSANLAAGSEQPVAISTSVDSNISLSLAAALALAPNVTITTGTTTLDLGNGNGARTYKGTIALSNGCTIAQAYQYLMAICSDGQTGLINGVQGQFFRALDEVNYTVNSAAPFGTLAGGKWFVAQGWKLTGVLPAESQNYQLIDDAGVTQVPPNVVGITVGGLVAGDTIIVARDSGTDLLMNEYTLNGAHSSAATSVVVNEAIKTDTPSTGTIRIKGLRFAYTAFNAATKTFTLSAALGTAFNSGDPAFVPFLDKTAASTSESVSFIYNAGFTARVKVRLGSGASAIVPFETTFSVGAGGGSANAIRNLDQ